MKFDPQAVIDAVQDTIFVQDRDGKLIYVSPSVRQLGYEPDELLGSSFAVLLSEGGVETAAVRSARRHAGEEPWELEITHRSGHKVWLQVRTTAVYDAASELLYSVGIARDISDRKELERLLGEHTGELERRVEEQTRSIRESEQRFRELAEMFPDAIFEANPKGDLTYANHKAFELFGYTAEAIEDGVSAFAMLVPEDVERALANFQMRAAGELAGLTEYTAQRADGGTFPVLLHAAPILRDGKAIGVRGLLIDISQRKLMEQQLRDSEERYRQAQRMEALGTLAGGVAHDFNNLLMGIQGHVALLRDDGDKPDAVQEHAASITSFLESAAELTRQLLGLAQTGKYHAEPVEVARLVDGCVSMFARTKKELPIHLSHNNPAAIVEADRAQIEQVLLNLLINAWQAMPEGGEIRIETSVISPDAATREREQIDADRYVCVAVRDTGIGMSSEVRARVFEPFFTTKERGRGTGLGLASSYGIVKNHGGFIDVDSTESQGSVFRLFLPLSDALPKSTAATSVTVPGRTTTVLIVDDEKHVARILGRLLTRMGHDVLVTTSGRSAIELLRDNVDRVEVVILDMIMPGMNGTETFAGLRAVNPAVKIILSSGYSSQDATTPELLDSCEGFLQKPWTPEQLTEKINQALA